MTKQVGIKMLNGEQPNREGFSYFIYKLDHWIVGNAEKGMYIRIHCLLDGGNKVPKNNPCFDAQNPNSNLLSFINITSFTLQPSCGN